MRCQIANADLVVILEVDRPEWTRDAGSGEEFKRHGRGRKGAPDREVKVEKVGISRHSIFGILILRRNERSHCPISGRQLLISITSTYGSPAWAR